MRIAKSVGDVLATLLACAFVPVCLSFGTLRAALPNPNPPTTPVKLMFIHHSTGENWLSDDNGRLGIALRDNNYLSLASILYTRNC